MRIGEFARRLVMCHVEVIVVDGKKQGQGGVRLTNRDMTT